MLTLEKLILALVNALVDLAVAGAIICSIADPEWALLGFIVGRAFVDGWRSC